MGNFGMVKKDPVKQNKIPIVFVDMAFPSKPKSKSSLWSHLSVKKYGWWRGFTVWAVCPGFFCLFTRLETCIGYLRIQVESISSHGDYLNAAKNIKVRHNLCLQCNFAFFSPQQSFSINILSIIKIIAAIVRQQFSHFQIQSSPLSPRENKGRGQMYQFFVSSQLGIAWHGHGHGIRDRRPLSRTVPLFATRIEFQQASE